MLLPKLKSVASAVLEIIAIGVWVGVANPQSWGRARMVPFETAW